MALLLELSISSAGRCEGLFEGGRKNPSGVEKERETGGRSLEGKPGVGRLWCLGTEGGEAGALLATIYPSSLAGDEEIKKGNGVKGNP